ncbi:MAG: exodeoxyribonuclease III [Bacteroidetes bacterium]|nr:MAG: exodeoxyribonuclease III [Bacteroidota bacterium]PTM14986.1 MAG: exodeoxyribonuclease III [Bacteroidota bacterium]
MQIISYNVNGIRAAQRKGLTQWLSDHNFDIVCLQETKATLDQVDMSELEQLGYHHYWHSAEKKGYSGVLTLSRKEPSLVVEGMGMPAYDQEGRVLRTDFGDWTLLNCYFPSGTTGEARQAFKMKFLADFQAWVEELRKERPQLIIVGDYNIAHEPIDIHDPVGNKKSSGFLPEERDWMTQWLASGFTDSFRYLEPEKVEYSWWTYRANARANNKGWRIDYLAVTNNLTDKLVAARHCSQVEQSDHCPVWLELNL